MHEKFSFYIGHTSTVFMHRTLSQKVKKKKLNRNKLIMAGMEKSYFQPIRNFCKKNSKNGGHHISNVYRNLKI